MWRKKNCVKSIEIASQPPPREASRRDDMRRSGRMEGMILLINHVSIRREGAS
jgi:hypothetical protein